MRMLAGMMDLSIDFIYGGKLKDGKGTALSEIPEAEALKRYISDMCPSVKP